ncbi:peptidoglycan recognition family protein [Micromonospora purpureochromogenes]|uniref:peptidoglycan recognition family protein n=1 Tax=Micromonospora purpureochromogenes TaxID=47872 RepID=UPI0033EF8103
MIVPGVKYVPGRNDYSDRDGQKYGVAIHNTSNDAPASGEASYATRRTDGVSAHFYVDDREVIQSIDTKYRTGHAGSSAGNENAVSVEITGTNSKSRAWWIANVAWDDLGRVLAAVCRAYDIEPRRASVAEMKANPKVRAFYSHDDMRRAWGGTTHTDPGGNFPWDYLFASVKQAMGPATPPPVQEDDMTPEEQRDADIWPNGYGDAKTNPSITLGTFVRNVGRDTEAARKELEELRTQVAELASRPAAAVDYDQLADALLRRVIAGGANPANPTQ